MMPEKRSFGQLLRQELKKRHHLFSRENVSSSDCQLYVQEIHRLWGDLGPLTDKFQLEILEGKTICFLRTLSREEKKEWELARIPLETGREGKGADLLQLTWLLILESWDQLLARRLEKEKGELHLDWLITFQEKGYARLIEEMEGKSENE